MVGWRGVQLSHAWVRNWEKGREKSPGFRERRVGFRVTEGKSSEM